MRAKEIGAWQSRKEKGRWFEFDSKEPISPGFISKIEKEKTSTESLKPKTLVSGNCN